ncbi:Fic/DOC family protein [Oceanospirillum linum]|uniref:protein adenylyltransferase n=1 Tax=Oceanospirillum linum TaxID=966 RepID=A0A1T1HGB1_OCELI|nr:Fic family protein [Oceanospirillum linum]OOV88891.1 cell filamentation protein Fic [Oceanospirillum linum]SEF46765.1 cell filamentation protein [Oleiphilus messinensis]SMP02276.1 cell filamentation protein [Oceanospirillum linum]
MKYSIGSSEGDLESETVVVLKNRLGITDINEMNLVEEEMLHKLYESIFSPEFQLSSLSVSDIRRWHYRWLNPIYEWGGELRTVNMSKGGFLFAGAKYISVLLNDFEMDFLSQFENLMKLDESQLVSLLARSHVEFILLHPFREGNGRISRLLMDVMAVQAGFSALDYSIWDQNKDFYFKSIQAGVAGDYQYIERLVRDILDVVKS